MSKLCVASICEDVVILQNMFYFYKSLSQQSSTWGMRTPGVLRATQRRYAKCQICMQIPINSEVEVKLDHSK